MNVLSRRGGYIITIPINTGITKNTQKGGYVEDAINFDITHSSLKRRKGYKTIGFYFDKIRGVLYNPITKDLLCVADKVYKIPSLTTLESSKRFNTQTSVLTERAPTFDSTYWDYSVNSDNTASERDTNFNKLLLAQRDQLIPNNSFETALNEWQIIPDQYFSPPTVSRKNVYDAKHGSYVLSVENGHDVILSIFPKTNDKIKVPYSYGGYNYSQINKPMFCDFYYKTNCTALDFGEIEFGIYEVKDNKTDLINASKFSITKNDTVWKLARLSFTPKKSGAYYYPLIILKYKYLNGEIYFDYFFHRSQPAPSVVYSMKNTKNLYDDSSNIRPQNYRDTQVSVQVYTNAPSPTDLVLKVYIDFYKGNTFLQTITAINSYIVSGSYTYTSWIQVPVNADKFKMRISISGYAKVFQSMDKILTINSVSLKNRVHVVYEDTEAIILSSDKYSGVSFYDNFYIVGEKDIYKIKTNYISKYDYLNGARYVCLHKDRLWFAGVSVSTPSAIVFTTPNEPDKPIDYLPASNVIIVDPDAGGEITGLFSQGERLIIFKETGVYGILGDTEENFYLQKILNVGGDNPNTIVQYKNNIIYTNNNQVYMLSRDAFRQLTNDIDITIPENANAYIVDDKYILDCGGKIYVYHINYGGWTRYENFDFNGSVKGDAWYLYDEHEIYKWGEMNDDGDNINTKLTLNVIPEPQSLTQSRIRKFSFEYTPFVPHRHKVKMMQTDIPSFIEEFVIVGYSDTYARFASSQDGSGGVFDEAYFVDYPIKSNTVLIPQSSCSQGVKIIIESVSDMAYSDKIFEIFSVSLLKRERRVCNGRN